MRTRVATNYFGSFSCSSSPTCLGYLVPHRLAMLLPVLLHLGPQCWLDDFYSLLSLLCWNIVLICERLSPLIATWFDFVRLAPFQSELVWCSPVISFLIPRRSSLDSAIILAFYSRNLSVPHEGQYLDCMISALGISSVCVSKYGAVVVVMVRSSQHPKTASKPFSISICMLPYSSQICQRPGQGIRCKTSFFLN
jgi:hypothetical protein